MLNSGVHSFSQKSFKWPLKYILHYDTAQILALIQHEIFEEETLSSKNTAKCKDFTMPKRTSS